MYGSPQNSSFPSEGTAAPYRSGTSKLFWRVVPLCCILHTFVASTLSAGVWTLLFGCCTPRKVYAFLFEQVCSWMTSVSLLGTCGLQQSSRKTRLLRKSFNVIFSELACSLKSMCALTTQQSRRCKNDMVPPLA